MTRSEAIPFPLWEAAVCLTDSHSVFQVARTLRLDYSDLKARTKSVAFVELDPFMECSVEIEKPSGERMRIRGACNVMELTRAFLA